MGRDVCERRVNSVMPFEGTGWALKSGTLQTGTLEVEFMNLKTQPQFWEACLPNAATMHDGMTVGEMGSA